MGFNPINLDNIFEDEDPLNAWIEEREEPTLDAEHSSSWLPEELLNDTDNENVDEGDEGVDMDSPTASNEEDDQLSTSSSGGGGGVSGRNNEGGYQNEPQQRYYTPSYGNQGMNEYNDPGLFGNVPTSSHSRGVRNDGTYERMKRHFHDSFVGSSSTNENEVSESSSQSFHSYNPIELYPPYLGQNPSYHAYPTNETYHGSIPPDYAYNLQHGIIGDYNQDSDANRDSLDPAHHSFWW